MDRGKLVLEGTPKAVFAQQKLLEDLKLGVPLKFQISSLLDRVSQSTTIEQLKTKISQILDY